MEFAKVAPTPVANFLDLIPDSSLAGVRAFFEAKLDMNYRSM